jgi:hypothetical protein
MSIIYTYLGARAWCIPGAMCAFGSNTIQCFARVDLEDAASLFYRSIDVTQD